MRKYSDQFLENAFLNCLNNKAEILQGNLCGCFLCLKTFLPSEIKEWIDEPNKGDQTAACPNCTGDFVISSKFPVDDEIFLKEMQEINFLG
jgi:hypothetical protein